MSNSKDAMKDVKEFLAQCFQSVNGQFDKVRMGMYMYVCARTSTTIRRGAGGCRASG